MYKAVETSTRFVGVAFGEVKSQGAQVTSYRREWLVHQVGELLRSPAVEISGDWGLHGELQVKRGKVVLGD